MFDYSKLLGRMREKHLSQSKLAELITLSANSMSTKMNCKGGRTFTSTEIWQLCKILDIPRSKIGEYFFTLQQEEKQWIF